MKYQDHDQRFKTLIQEFFEEFMRLFFAVWADRLDCSSPEWLQQEVYPDPPDGARRVLDLVARVRARQPVPGYHGSENPTEWLAMVLIEIESPDSAARLRSNMLRRYIMLRDKYDLPVLPIAVFLKVGLDGVGIDVFVESLLEMEIVQFRFLYVGLPGLDAVQYLEGDNWLGVALSALMRIPKEKIAWLGAEALRRLIEAPLEERKRFLLGECVQAYLQMDESQQREYDRLLEAKPYQGVKAMNLTVFEKGEISGIQKGRQEGRQEGQREMLRDQMEDKFGELPREILDQLGKLPVERLYPLSRAILRANSLDDLGLVD